MYFNGDRRFSLFEAQGFEFPGVINKGFEYLFIYFLINIICSVYTEYGSCNKCKANTIFSIINLSKELMINEWLQPGFKITHLRKPI